METIGKTFYCFGVVGEGDGQTLARVGGERTIWWVG